MLYFSTSGEKQQKPVDVEHEKVKNKQSEQKLEFNEWSDYERDPNIAKRNQKLDDLDYSIWYIMSPHGFKRGPYSMLEIKQWNLLLVT